MNSSGVFKKALQSLQTKQFTGRIDVKRANGIQWRVYFCLSRLVWADGGYHPYSQWEKLFKKYCPDIDPRLLEVEKHQEFECWNYHILVSLLRRFLITKEQALSIIKSTILQTIFDIYQAETEEKLSYEIVKVRDSFPEESGLKNIISLLTIGPIVEDLEKEWQLWQKQGITRYNPHKAPIVKNPILLQGAFQGKEKTYRKLVSLLNGKSTLIEIAEKLNLTVFKLIVWLKPFLEKDLIALVDTEDKPTKFSNNFPANNQHKIDKTTSQILIMCIDDSIQTCQIMEHIITEAGYQYVAVRDPLKALPEILKHKPDLIFLDLIMPIVNGYEICSQIRRIRSLKDIPVIILTSNDGMFDRLRSKIVGASGFLSKPIDQEKVLAKIRYFLRRSPTNIDIEELLSVDTKTQK